MNIDSAVMINAASIPPSNRPIGKRKKKPLNNPIRKTTIALPIKDFSIWKLYQKTFVEMAGIEPACESVMREPATNLVQSIWDSELKTEQKTHCPARIDFPQTSSNQRNQRELEL